MEKVSISKLKDQLSAYLKKVKAGQTLVVTDRNEPIARLTPVPERENDDERIARLVALGIIRLPQEGPPLDLEEILRRRPVVKGAGVLEALLEERREGR